MVMLIGREAIHFACSVKMAEDGESMPISDEKAQEKQEDVKVEKIERPRPV